MGSPRNLLDKDGNPLDLQLVVYADALDDAIGGLALINIDSREMAAKILDVGGVAVLSGTAFGEGGDGYLRLSYANSVENINEAIARMKPVVEPHVL